MRWMMAVSLALMACGTTGNPQMVEVAGTTPAGTPAPEVREAQAAGVTVKLLEYAGGDLFEFDVKNLGMQPLLVDRDAVEMILPTGDRRQRLPGGAATSYTIQPASAHHVNVRFDMSSLQPGDLMRFDFAHALQIPGGANIPLTIAARYN